RRFIILHAASLRARRGTLCLDRGTAGSLVAARGGTDRVGSGGVSHDGLRPVASQVRSAIGPPWSDAPLPRRRSAASGHLAHATPVPEPAPAPGHHARARPQALP